MTKKQIILLVSMLLIFSVVMAVILVNRFKPSSTEETTITEHNYAENGTFETTEQIVETYNVQSQGYYYDHAELLTDEQTATRVHMNNLVYYDFIQAEHPGDTVISATILDTSTEEIVFIQFELQDSDGVVYTDTAVALYDMYNTHDFMRCVSLDYYNSLQ